MSQRQEEEVHGHGAGSGHRRLVGIMSHMEKSLLCQHLVVILKKGNCEVSEKWSL